jgi:hypothetical protein
MMIHLSEVGGATVVHMPKMHRNDDSSINMNNMNRMVIAMEIQRTGL